MNRVAGVVAVLAVVSLVWWSGIRTDKQLEAMQKYEECVVQEYGVMPSTWYYEHGELPECDYTKNQWQK